MIRCGVDIIEIERIRKAVEKDNGFCEKVFSKEEIRYFESTGRRFESLAGFFAAKEAFAKYMKSGVRGFELSDISVEHEDMGAPFVVFKGKRQNVSLNISHNKTQAVAVVCGDDGKCALEKNPEMKRLIPEREEDAHKGDCGRVLIVAGSEGMTGAAVLSARGALRSGAGLVTVATPNSQRGIVACCAAEAMTVGLDEENGKLSAFSLGRIVEYAKKSDCVVFGPGLGQNEYIHGILKGFLSEYEGILIIDADGLNGLSKNCDILHERKCSVVITPHPGEMSRLTGKSIDEIQKNRQTVATELASKYGITVLLKGKDTVIAHCDEISGECEMFINPTGNCGMATGGMGDVLSGVIAAFGAQGLKPFDAARLGAYIHGKAGDMGTEKFGVHGLVAGDVAELVAMAIKSELE